MLAVTTPDNPARGNSAAYKHAPVMEELWLSEENPQPTAHNKILRAEPTTHYRTSEFEKMITELLENSAAGDRKAVIKTIRAILPEFQSTPKVAGKTVLPR